VFVFEDMLLLDAVELEKYRPQNSLMLKLECLDLIVRLATENVYFSRKTIIDSALYEHIFRLF
jgi:hypothetical protein